MDKDDKDDNLNVFIIYKEDYPWDVRVEKLALSISNSGSKVVIISQNLHNRPVKENYDSYSVHRLPKIRYASGFIRKLVNIPFWFNPFWLVRIYRSIKNHDNALIIVRDLPLLNSAIIISKLLKANVVYDMAEVYPEMYASGAQYTSRSLASKIIKNPSIAAHYESSMLRKVDHTFVMIEESYNRLLKKGVPGDKVTIVSNTPAVDKFKGLVKHHSGTTLYLVYVGFVTRLRGLDLLIRATSEFIKSQGMENSIYIDIVGKGSAKGELETLVSELQLENNVRIHGWLEQSEVDSLMARANVGALTYRVCGHWNHTIPNKIFDYMLAGLPVLATPVIPIARIVNTTDSGVVSTVAAPEQISRSLQKLIDPEVRNRLGTNGHQAVLDRYNWDEDEKKLLRVCASFGQPSLSP